MLDYLLNYYIQNEYGKELQEKMAFYLNKSLSMRDLEMMQMDFTNWIHQALHNSYESVDSLKLNPQASVRKNSVNPNELTIRFVSHPSTKVL